MSEEEIPPRESWDPIDEALYGPEDLYRVGVGEADRLRLQAIRFSFNRHYNRNRFYHALCEQRGMTPEDVKTLDDLAKVPLIPGDIFKGYPEPERFVMWLRGISCDDVKYPKVEGSSYEELIDRLSEHGLKVIFSTGTSGRCTFCPRDQITLSRQAYHRRHHRRLLGSDPGGYFVWMGPDVRNSSWGIAQSIDLDRSYFGDERVYYAMDYKSTLATTRFILGRSRGLEGKPEIFDGRAREEADLKLIRVLEDLSKKGAKGEFGGPVFLVNDFLSKMEDLGVRLNMDRWIFRTGSGWKRGDQEMVPREALIKKVERVLGIPDRNFRDIYGLTECTACFTSCEGHYYHIPHTVIHPFVLDESLEPRGFGDYGQFAFIDVLSNAYPGYIITKDRVKVLESCPSCDRPGPVISPPVTRMPGVEDRGCVYAVRRLMIEEMTHA